MAVRIRKIKQLPARITPYLRFRHAKGHGIHSPFVYGIIRNALMRGNEPVTPEGELYSMLRRCGVNRLRAGQIQNLHNYCDYRRAGIFTGPEAVLCGQEGHDEDTSGKEAGAVWLENSTGKGVLQIFTGQYPATGIEAAGSEFRSEAGAVIIISPRSDKERYRVCKGLVDAGDCISIDNRGFLLLIYGSGHTPRHYKL